MLLTAARKRIRQIFLVLLFLGLLALTVCVRNLLQPPAKSVAEAESRSRRTKAKLESALWVVSSAERLAQRVDPGNSAIHQTIQAVGLPAIQELQKEHLAASIHAAIARTVANADHCVQVYEKFDHAEDAMAILHRSGIKDVFICPDGPSGVEAKPLLYRVMVPRSFAVKAETALDDMQMLHRR